MTSEGRGELKVHKDSSPPTDVPTDPKAYEVHDPPVVIGQWVWRPWTRFSLRKILFVILLACILLAVLRPRHEPEPPPRVMIRKTHIRGNGVKFCEYAVKFPDGSRETYFDVEPYGSLDSLVLYVNGQRREYRRGRPDFTPKRLLKPEMHETFQQLSKRFEKFVDVKLFRYGKRVRMDLPRDFPKMEELLLQKNRPTPPGGRRVTSGSCDDITWSCVATKVSWGNG